MPRDYQRIATAIQTLSQQQGRVSLQQLAEDSGLSPWHFQRVFCRWAGISPNRFQQFMTVHRAQQLLTEGRPLLDISEQLGLSSSSRLHSHFVRVEGMTPGEFRAGGRSLTIDWGCGDTPFGPAFIASTERGICSLSFDAADQSLRALQQRFPAAHFRENQSAAGKRLSRFLRPDIQRPVTAPLTLHVLASDFQLQVWRALLEIPPGELRSYGALASAIKRPGSARAVGRAVGSNPVAVLIPCHRVIRESGELGGYRWGLERKRAVLLQECCDALTDDADQSAS
ncbi:MULTISPECIES: methylated-DNA--[protein]-cysteine S-methyltransferase [Spongiibacter]|uniref:bifunctional helix-turn-helix domain-containing protein/methylated-DNA--[protein]-cysteine S-methyltransferase n=1 Tax=Spongiibacter TaxID=630749 RepID=UPI001AFF86BD|nr:MULTISPECIES: methylated-DNA--[protein]-cysteine S-methyltransferase [Spongiibacter]MBO6751923.1 methylated-DNA--[protein]-cysteine S-methyltransferase [Spongiibacter sp.]